MADPKFARGAIATPRHKLGAARPYFIRGATPSQVIVVPSFLEFWLNDQWGDCVSAEEAFAKAAYSVMQGQAETKITDTTVKAFCDKWGFLNGAMLPDVMDKMISDGFVQDNGYKDGPYSSVDYSNEAVLQNAIANGPVKIGIDANALPAGAGNQNGWSAFGGTPGQFNNEDHCTSLCGYGPTSALFGALGVPVPSGAPANGYLHYTWSTIGVVDHAWIMSTCGEAWIRNPTTVGVGPVPVPPGPTPIPPGPTPTPTPTLSGTVTIPDQTIPVGGLFHQMIMVKGGTYPVVFSQSATALTLPPWVLPLLKAACALAPLAPPPYNVILEAICSALPANAHEIAAQGHSVTITALPPWVLPLLKSLCALDILLPQPYQAVVAALCSALPQSKCSGC